MVLAQVQHVSFFFFILSRDSRTGDLNDPNSVLCTCYSFDLPRSLSLLCQKYQNLFSALHDQATFQVPPVSSALPSSGSLVLILLPYSRCRFVVDLIREDTKCFVNQSGHPIPGLIQPLLPSHNTFLLFLSSFLLPISPPFFLSSCSFHLPVKSVPFHLACERDYAVLCMHIVVSCLFPPIISTSIFKFLILFRTDSFLFLLFFTVH